MKKVLAASVFFLTLPFAVGAQVATTTSNPPQPTLTPLPDPGFVPGDFLYFFDRFGEGFNFFYTFSPEAKARLALHYAQERAAEIAAVLKTKGADSSEALRAKADFDKNLGRASDSVLEAKNKGLDVSASARAIDDQFEASRAMLKNVYHLHYEDLKNEDEKLREHLTEAERKSDAAEKARVEGILEKHAREMNQVIDDEDSLDNDFDEEKSKLEASMGEQQSAESHITNAKRARIQFVAEVTAQGTATSTATVEALTEFDKLLEQAVTAFGIKDYENAKEYAKEAKHALNDARSEIDIEDIEKSFFEDEKESLPENSRKMSPEEFERQGGEGNPAHIEGDDRAELE